LLQNFCVKKRRLVVATVGMLALASFSTWLLAADARGPLPFGDFSPRRITPWTLTGPDAAAMRRDVLHRAAIRLAAPTPPVSLSDDLECLFLKEAPSGTTAKFDCVLDGGEVVKVKYGHNAEIQAEVAATRLLSTLGLAADRVDIVPRLRCHGCPRYPFFTMQLLSLLSADTLLADHGLQGYTDFRWVSVERRFPAPAVETADLKGWAWFELEGSQAPRAELDALRLLAVFLAHWDNKSENQRLVCLDGAPPCLSPLLMIQDLGASFGPSKVNLERWRTLPVWADARTCAVSMHNLPFRGATFPDTRISEEGRALLARELARLSDDDLRALFAGARFPEFQASTDDERDLRAWVRAFHRRADQIAAAGPCPTASPTPHRWSARSD
jgi:hypothetical protein